MTELTDEAVKALEHKYRFAKDDNEHTIAKTARALLDARAELARVRADAELALAEERLAKAVEALGACIASLEMADTSEGVCCCGDNMEGHSDPMACGHIPVDMGDYYAQSALESARAILKEIDNG